MTIGIVIDKRGNVFEESASLSVVNRVLQSNTLLKDSRKIQRVSVLLMI